MVAAGKGCGAAGDVGRPLGGLRALPRELQRLAGARDRHGDPQRNGDHHQVLRAQQAISGLLITKFLTNHFQPSADHVLAGTASRQGAHPTNREYLRLRSSECAPGSGHC